MMEVNVNQLLTTIGRQTVEIDLLRAQVIQLQAQLVQHNCNTETAPLNEAETIVKPSNSE